MRSLLLDMLSSIVDGQSNKNICLNYKVSFNGRKLANNVAWTQFALMFRSVISFLCLVLFNTLSQALSIYTNMMTACMVCVCMWSVCICLLIKNSKRQKLLFI